MRKYLIGWIGLALMGGNALFAQSPTIAQYDPAGSQVGGPMVMAGAENVCPMETKIVCVPEHYVKTTKKTVYGSGCEPFCPGCCHGLFGHCDCDCGHCGPALTRRYLTKKVYTCEKDAVKCVPQEVLVSEGEGLLHRGCPCRHGDAQYEVPTVAAQVPTVAAQVPTVAAPMGSVAAPPPPPAPLPSTPKLK